MAVRVFAAAVSVLHHASVDIDSIPGRTFLRCGPKEALGIHQPV